MTIDFFISENFIFYNQGVKIQPTLHEPINWIGITGLFYTRICPILLAPVQSTLHPNVIVFCCLWFVGAFTALALNEQNCDQQQQGKKDNKFFHPNVFRFKKLESQKVFVQNEPMTRIELVTPSLPRKYSTPELHRQYQSGRRDSNPRPSAWKANALSTELLPQCDKIITNN